MSDAAGLMQAILGPGTPPDQARAELDAAMAREIDPLRWCAIRLGMDQVEVMRRAALWVRLGFFATKPGMPRASVAPARLEMLAEMRMCRVTLLDRDVAFAAPDFFGVLRLKRATAADPSLAKRLFLVPPAVLRALLVDMAQEALIDGARQNLARSWPHAAAQLDLTGPLRWMFALGMVLLSAALVAAPLWGQVWIMPIWAAVMLLPTAMRLGALAVPDMRRPRMRRDPDGELPLFSIMVPLRDEANMVDQLCEHLGRLDYPAEKLEIIFVVESRSPETISAVESHFRDSRLSLVVVPDAMPRTKPKALDFALPFCSGEFVVVYDAEDRPEPGQLRAVVHQFRRDPKVECVQARLTIDNGGRGLLPALFTGEYAGLFAVLLPALAHWGAVMPLGGTSNHFRLSTLRRIGGWDAYNVTEDADLGVRLARRQLRTATTVSVTLEDAPTSLQPWMGQRTRWMKGWMQTFVVHNRRLPQLVADLGLRRFMLFQLTILSMLLAPLLHFSMWPTLVWMHFATVESGGYWNPWQAACLLVLVLGHGTAIVVNMVGLSRIGRRGLWLQQLALPVYWLLTTWATILALREFVARPFHWFKTPHHASETVEVPLQDPRQFIAAQ